MYKWVFFALLLALTPALITLLRDRRHLPKAGFALGALPFFLNLHLYSAPYAWLAWPGPAKGIEVSVSDAIALAIIVVTPRVRIPSTLKVAAGIYFAGLLISTALAVQVVPAIFYVWQIFRVMLMCVAVARATAISTEFATGLAAGTAVAALIQAALAIEEMLRGASQAGGSIGHQNTLGLMSHFAVMPAFALLLAGRNKIFALATIASGGIIVLAGASRASMGLFAIGLIITLIFSMKQFPSGRKTTLGIAAVAALALTAPAMMWAIDRRESVNALDSSDDQRVAMVQAAKLMFADHPFGVGANQYVVVANVGGYSQRAGVSWSYYVRSAPVHNSYYLTLAETGVIGMIGYAAMLLSFLRLGLQALRRRAVANVDLVPGFLSSLIVAAAHSAFEWTALSYQVESLVATSVGACVGILRATPSEERLANQAARQPTRSFDPKDFGEGGTFAIK